MVQTDTAPWEFLRGGALVNIAGRVRLKARGRLELANKYRIKCESLYDIISYFCSRKCTLVAVWTRDQLEAER